jgi:hypothetical protein
MEKPVRERIVKCGVFVSPVERGEALVDSSRARFAHHQPVVTMMSRRNAPNPNLEIVPRDRAVRRVPARLHDAPIEAQQFGPRLRKMYSPVEQQPEDMRMLIVALDHKLQKQ